MPYVLPGGRKVSPDQGFVLGDIQYPPNWLRHATEQDKSGLGITWENDPAPEPPPAPTKDQLKSYAASKRWSIQISGATVAPGVKVDTSTDSLALITGAIESLERGWTTAPVKFKALTGWVDLTLVQLQGAGAAASQHIQNCFVAENAVVAKIESNTYTTYAQIDSASEWPAV